MSDHYDTNVEADAVAAYWSREVERIQDRYEKRIAELRSQLTAQEARAKELEADNKRLRSALNAIGDTLMGAARPKRDFTMHEGSILVTVRDVLAPPAQSTQGSGEDG